MKFETILAAYWDVALEYKAIERILSGGNLRQSKTLPYYHNLYDRRMRQGFALRARLLKMWEESQNEREWYPLR